jgi:hypothetical protein
VCSAGERNFGCVGTPIFKLLKRLYQIIYVVHKRGNVLFLELEVLLCLYMDGFVDQRLEGQRGGERRTQELGEWTTNDIFFPLLIGAAVFGFLFLASFVFKLYHVFVFFTFYNMYNIF